MWNLWRTRRRARIGEFCHEIGLDYVSCSPFRVPARLAAAHAALGSEEGKKSTFEFSPLPRGGRGELYWNSREEVSSRVGIIQVRRQQAFRG